MTDIPSSVSTKMGKENQVRPLTRDFTNSFQIQQQLIVLFASMSLVTTDESNETSAEDQYRNKT